MNIENLKRAQELIKVIPQENFDMRFYMNECGTVGCILGHCLRNFSDIKHANDIEYRHWSEEFFGIKKFSLVHDYLFHSHWKLSKLTNTPEHAVYRIQRIIDGYKPYFISNEIKKEIVAI